MRARIRTLSRQPMKGGIRVGTRTTGSKGKRKMKKGRRMMGSKHRRKDVSGTHGNGGGRAGGISRCKNMIRLVICRHIPPIMFCLRLST